MNRYDTTSVLAVLDADMLRAHADFMRKVACSLVRGDADADDVVQESWLSALRRGPADPRTPRGWLATVVRRRAVDQSRQKARQTKRDKEAPVRSVATDPAQIARVEETRTRVLGHVMALDENYRVAVLLRYYHGLDATEAAEALAVPVATFRTRLQRALAKLRGALDRDGVRADRGAGLALLSLAGMESATASAATGAGLGVLICAALAVVGVGFWWSLAPQEPGSKASGALGVKMAEDAAPAGDRGAEDAELRERHEHTLRPGEPSLVVRGGHPENSEAKSEKGARVAEKPKSEARVRTGVVIVLEGPQTRPWKNIQVEMRGPATYTLGSGAWRSKYFGVRPGSYQLIVRAGASHEFLSGPTPFEVTSGQVTGPVHVTLAHHSARATTGLRLALRVPSGRQPKHVAVRFQSGRRAVSGRYYPANGLTVVKPGSYEMVVFAGNDHYDWASEPRSVTVDAEARAPDVLDLLDVDLLPIRSLRVRLLSEGTHAGIARVRYARLAADQAANPDTPGLLWIDGRAHENAHPRLPGPPRGARRSRVIRFDDVSPGRYLVAVSNRGRPTRRYDFREVTVADGPVEVTLTLPTVTRDEYVAVRLEDPDGDAIKGWKRFGIGYGMDNGNGGQRGRAEIIEERDGVYYLLPYVNVGSPGFFRGPGTPEKTPDTLWGYPWTRGSTSGLSIFVTTKSDEWGAASVRGRPKAGEVMRLRFRPRAK